MAWSMLGGDLSGGLCGRSHRRHSGCTPGGGFPIVLPARCCGRLRAMERRHLAHADIDSAADYLCALLVGQRRNADRVGHDRSGSSAVAAARTTVTNPGTVRSYPTFRVISGPSTAGGNGVPKYHDWPPAHLPFERPAGRRGDRCRFSRIISFPAGVATARGQSRPARMMPVFPRRRART